jgi:sugar (pentulose or hexulose) kinase
MAEQKDLILTIDNGTQSVRVLLFDLNGNLVAKGKQIIEPYVSPKPGWAEQDVDVYWEALKQASHQMWQSTSVNPQRVVGVSVTAQRGTVVCVNANGKVIRPAIVWLDQRLATDRSHLKWYWRWTFKILRLEKTIQSFITKAQANWLAQNESDNWAQTDKFLLLSGYLNYRLTGEFKDSVASQVGYLPFDYKRQAWAGTKDWRWQALAIKRDMLPELVKPGELIGQLTESSAKLLNLPANLSVYASASDKACEILGSGAIDPATASMSYGTTATINTTRSKYKEALRFIPPFPAAIPDYFSNEVMIYRGFWMVSWFKQEFGLHEEQLAKEQGVETEALFEDLINQVPAGSMGLMLQPYWSPGLKQPGPEAKGAIIGFGDIHNRAHLYRAMIEGLAYALKEGMHKLQNISATKVNVIRVSGGGSQSDAILQLTADVFGIAVERPHTYETSGLGAAINVAVGAKKHPDYRQAVESMCHIGKRFEPNKTTHQIYSRLYQEVYLKMYSRLQPLYRKIQDITGYPAK